LTISRRLVEMMGGEIWAESEPDAGSVIQFTARLGIQTRPQPRKAVDRDELTGLRALVVDDNASAREILSSMAVSLGMEVDSVHDGAAALKEVEAARKKGTTYDILLLDWQMPGMDGVEVSKQLQEIENETPPYCKTAASKLGCRPARKRSCNNCDRTIGRCAFERGCSVNRPR